MNTKTKSYIKYVVSIGILSLMISGGVLYAQTSDTQMTDLQPSSSESSTEELISDEIITTTGTEVAAADLTEPSDVENLKATAGDSQVQLNWDSSTDNVAVTGYKIYRGTHNVKNTQDTYDLPVIPVGTVQTYTVKNLTNGQAYYFSLTAVDAAGNESVNYATEVSAIPQSGLRLSSIEDDGAAPKVTNVVSEDLVTVVVTFSEPIKLPEEFPASAFEIENTAKGTRLQVQKAEIDARDETGKTVVLTTAPQEKDMQYVLTAGIEIQDYYNNPIISGTSDTGSFEGSDKAQAQTPPSTPVTGNEDSVAPLVIGGSADFNNRIALNFSEPVKLSGDPKSHFAVTSKTTGTPLVVIEVSLSPDAKTAYLTTAPQEPVEYEVLVSAVTDVAGNEVAANASSAVVTGKSAGIEDLIPPEDVTNLIARIKDVKNNIVELRWTASKNSAGDLADQLLYQSQDREGRNYGGSTSVGASTTAVEVHDLQGGNWYTFKIGAKDTSGNESQGAVTSIYLPQTGPGMVAAGITGLFMAWYRKRKSKHKMPRRS